ncbi:hypothetical protein B6D52_02045 [Candidatus Parcubacteria bacterium 4484_255]|nr:MAG: hypothetical protein B6D52_02045 [Candidatus Parcubacteria bacterium 4484_255]
MKNIFLILGYGIPKNIFKDENYNFYLKMVFNKIYDLVTKNKIKAPIIICSGGKTDMFKPYNKRSEADEMIKFLKKLSKKLFLKEITKDWLFVSEKKSFSTLENLLNCQKIIQERKIRKFNLYIFCEQTRGKRTKTLSKKILDKNYTLQVIPIDFDVSSNRYISHEFFVKKEKAELSHSLWALQSPENLKKHHKLFKERIIFLRKAGPKVHVKVVKEWWEKKLKNLKTKSLN